MDAPVYLDFDGARELTSCAAYDCAPAAERRELARRFARADNVCADPRSLPGLLAYMRRMLETALGDADLRVLRSVVEVYARLVEESARAAPASLVAQHEAWAVYYQRRLTHVHKEAAPERDAGA